MTQEDHYNYYINYYYYWHYYNGNTISTHNHESF